MNLWELLITILIPLLAIGLLWFKIKRWIPQLIQSVLDDVGEQINEVFRDPAVSRAMSILGSKSGEVRSMKGAENSLAEGILAQIPEAQIVLDKLAPNLIEDYGADTVLTLLQKYAPMLKSFLGGAPQGKDISSSRSIRNRIVF